MEGINIEKVKCKCGNVLEKSFMHNDYPLRVYSDKDWDAVLNMNNFNIKKIPKASYEVWKCLNCGKLHIFNKHDRHIKIYEIEK